MTGDTISHFEILEVLGEGGMGVVYKARDTMLDRVVALKFLPKFSLVNESDHERFVVEARAAASLNHANICTVYEYDEVDGKALIAMECIEGPTLQEKLENGPLPVEEALDLTRQIAMGLAAAHAKGIVHRDIKPGNILLADGTTAKIADFGLAKLADTNLTQTGMTVGTVAYMAPEQAQGAQVGEGSDVWALGVVLYEMLTARSPFPGDYPTAKLYSIAHSEPLSMDDVESEFGQALRELLDTMLEKEPDARPSAAEIAERLKPTSVSGTLEAPALTEARPAVSKGILAGGHAAAVAIVAVSAVAAVAAAFAFGLIPTGSGIDLSTAGVAMLPVAIEDSTLKITLDGLVESASATMGRVAEKQNAVGQMIPFRDVLEQGVQTSEDVYGKLGAAFAIETRVTGIDPVPTIEFVLVEAQSGDEVSSTSMAVLTTDLHQSYLAALRHLSELLGVPDTSVIATETSSTSTDPEVFSLYTRATGLLQQSNSQRNIQSAIRLYNRALEKSPDYVPALAGLGRAHLRNFESHKDVEHLEIAERFSDRAIELDANLIDAYVTLGSVLVNKGKPGQARAVLERALQQEPFNTDALVGLSAVYEALDDFDRAEATLAKAVSSRPDYWSVYRSLGSYYYRRSDYERAAIQYQKIIDLAPLNALGYRNLGSMYYFMDSLDIAARYWRESLDIQPSYSGLSNLGVLSFSLGNYAEAAHAYEEALAINDKDYRVWGNLATAYFWMGIDRAKYRQTKTRAAEMAEEWLKVNPRDDEAKSRLAGYYGELGDAEKSRNILIKLESRSRDGLSGTVAFEVGAAWEAIGERERALGWIETAVEKGYSLTDITRYPGLEELRQSPEYLRIITSTSAGKPG
ncbi:MAG: protein kinase [Rhodothermia bacterium]